jgi:nickel-dependent lactate racemase
VNHDSRDPAQLLRAGMTQDGRPVWMNRDYVKADRRIVLGFIEPHFMAGFSGGYKGVFPAVADLDSIKTLSSRAGDCRSAQHVGACSIGTQRRHKCARTARLLPVDS